MKSESVELIKYLSYASVLTPLLFYILKFKGFPRENHIIGVLVIVSAVSDCVSFFLARARIPNSLLGNMYYFIFFLLLCWYYNEVVFKFKNRGYFYFGIGVYLIFVLVVTSRTGIYVFQGEVWALAGLILVVFGLIYNNYQIEKPPLLDKNLYSGLIFNAAVMFYFSFNFFLFIIANYVLTELSPETARMTWAFHNANNIIKNTAFAAGLYYTNRRRVNLSEEEVERIQWRHLQ